MAVHVPLSPKAQIESKVLMLASNNVLSPAHGRPLAVPSQDLVLGGYYLTLARDNTKGEGRVFSDFESVIMALDAYEVETQTKIQVRINGPYINLGTQYDNQDILHAELENLEGQLVETTVGRVIFNMHLPPDIPYVNGLLKKRGLQDLVGYCFIKLGNAKTVAMLDEMKEITFLYATKAGISIGIDDMVIPSTKTQLLDEADADVLEYREPASGGCDHRR